MELIYSEQLVSVFDGYRQAAPSKDMPFAKFVGLGFEYRERIEAVRGAATKEERDRLKALLPCATIAGTFYPDRSNGNLRRASRLMCLDIDKKENPTITDWQRLKEWLCKGDEHIVFASLSVSGEGLFVVYAISRPERYEQLYRRAEIDFGSWGIRLDSSCKNVGRLRVLSYDKQPYWNEFATPFDVDFEAEEAAPYTNAPQIPPTQAPQRPQQLAAGYHQPQAWQSLYRGRNAATVEDKVRECCAQISKHGIDVTSSYDDWLRVGMALASLGERGREYYHVCSSKYPSYKRQETDRKFDSCLRSRGNITIGTFFKICEDYGIRFKK